MTPMTASVASNITRDHDFKTQYNVLYLVPQDNPLDAWLYGTQDYEKHSSGQSFGESSLNIKSAVVSKLTHF